MDTSGRLNPLHAADLPVRRGGGDGGEEIGGYSEEQWDKKMKESKLKGVFTQLLTHLYVRLFLQRD